MSQLPFSNPGFENGMTDWEPEPVDPAFGDWSVTSDPSKVRSGAHALLYRGYTATSASTAAVAYIVHAQKFGPPEQRDAFKLTCHARITRPDEGALGTARFYVRFFDADDGRLGDVGGYGITIAGSELDTGWREVVIPQPFPAGAVKGQVFFYAMAAAGVEIMFDDFDWNAHAPGAFVPPTSPPQNPGGQSPTPAPENKMGGANSGSVKREVTPPRIPRPGEPIAGPGGQVTRSWRNYLASLAGAGDVSGMWSAIRDIRSQIGGSGGFPADTRVYGDASVASFGTLSDGVVVFNLVNDEAAPAPRSYYGTDADGTRGFHAIPEPPASGFLPMTTGEIVGGQPVFLYGPDGRLIYGPVS